ncbi:MAG: response regulator [Deltaproteobacteria bacterium]|nr:response regulator [Candidatus Anaeroferrophillus wilburensis]MBN2889196.1 response regulator [Deltaproteobacteria bacterium]
MKETILIVDDNLDNVELLRKRLRSMDYETIEGYDGEQAVQLTREHRPDMVLLDVMMPKLDGFEVCEILKQDEATRHIPILMLTAKREIPDKVKGLGLGADDYVTKPFNFQELLARIKSLLKIRREHQKQVELERQKALDQMVEGVAHEVRNPVVSIGGFARRILDELPDDDRKKKYAQVILKETERLERMVKDIFDFKMVPNGTREHEDIHLLLDNALHHLDALLAENNVAVTRNFGSDLPAVVVNRNNMTIAFIQVMTNAIEAMPQGGELTISTAAAENVQVRVVIADTGHGMADKDLESIFDPFYTTKMSGAGMGLPLVRKIIDDNHGLITVESKVGEGTRVSIILPGENQTS